MAQLRGLGVRGPGGTRGPARGGNVPVGADGRQTQTHSLGSLRLRSGWGALPTPGSPQQGSPPPQVLGPLTPGRLRFRPSQDRADESGEGYFLEEVVQAEGQPAAGGRQQLPCPRPVPLPSSGMGLRGVLEKLLEGSLASFPHMHLLTGQVCEVGDALWGRLPECKGTRLGHPPRGAPRQDGGEGAKGS